MSILTPETWKPPIYVRHVIFSLGLPAAFCPIRGLRHASQSVAVTRGVGIRAGLSGIEYSARVHPLP